MLITDSRIGEILERIVGPVHHDFGHRAQNGRGDIIGGVRILDLAVIRQYDVKDALGFGVHVTRKVKPRHISLGAARLFSGASAAAAIRLPWRSLYDDLRSLVQRSESNIACRMPPLPRSIV